MSQIDAIARRYGKWPHEVLLLDPFELALAGLCLQGAAKRAAERARAARRHPLLGGPIPVLDLEQ